MDKDKIKQAIRLFLEGIGEDPDRDGLRDTPQRVANMCEEIYSGIGADPAALFTVDFEESYDEIVLVKDIPFYSICEHHLVPFIGRAHVAYLPEGTSITGISKLARVVELHARRPQVQERLTTQIAESLMDALDPRGVMVVIEAEHLCMSMRGAMKPGAVTTTSAVRGIFASNLATRSEGMSLIKGER
jgi:GTP cyclohydrolase I